MHYAWISGAQHRAWVPLLQLSYVGLGVCGLSLWLFLQPVHFETSWSRHQHEDFLGRVFCGGHDA